MCASPPGWTTALDYGRQIRTASLDQGLAVAADRELVELIERRIARFTGCEPHPEELPLVLVTTKASHCCS